jgi:hypothetical protein
MRLLLRLDSELVVLVLHLSRGFDCGKFNLREEMNETPELVVSHLVDRVGLARWSRGGPPNPVRGGLFIDPPAPHPPNPFCFSAARRRAVRDSRIQGCRRAAEKQKGGFYSPMVSINRPPLTGFGENLERTACSRAKDACEVQVLPSHPRGGGVEEFPPPPGFFR